MFDIEILKSIQDYKLIQYAATMLISLIIIFIADKFVFKYIKNTYIAKIIYTGIIIMCIALMAISLLSNKTYIPFAKDNMHEVQFQSNDYYVDKISTFNGETQIIIKNSNGDELNQDFFHKIDKDLKKGDKVLIKTNILRVKKDIKLKDKYSIKDIQSLYIQTLGQHDLEYSVTKHGG